MEHEFVSGSPVKRKSSNLLKSGKSTKSKGFQCTECDKSFPTVQGLRNHVRGHQGKASVNSGQLNKRFDTNVRISFGTNTTSAAAKFLCSNLRLRIFSFRTKVKLRILFSDFTQDCRKL